jgi:hypothetical protein
MYLRRKFCIGRTGGVARNLLTANIPLDGGERFCFSSLRFSHRRRMLALEMLEEGRDRLAVRISHRRAEHAGDGGSEVLHADGQYASRLDARSGEEEEAVVFRVIASSVIREHEAVRDGANPLRFRS